MEKSIEYGFEHYIQLIPGVKEISPKDCSPLVLAYIGDCVFDLIIKTLVVGQGNRPVHKLHEETSRYVQASAQSFMMRSIQEHLTAEEHAVYRRGRNSPVCHTGKEPVDYGLPAGNRIRGTDRLSLFKSRI